MIFEELNEMIISWANKRGILAQSDSKSQLLKTMSELGELADAINKGDEAEVIDALGDTVVTLILVAEMEDLNLLECLNAAYDVISKRSGNMVNGVFIKD